MHIIISMFNKIMVLNRGEIVLRGLKACKDLGIETLVVYSEADSNAKYLLNGQQKHLLEGDNRQVYLDADQIISIAKKTG